MNAADTAQAADSARTSDPYHASGQSGQAQGGALPLLELGGANASTHAGSGLLGVLLEIAEESALRATLAAWQREQDRLANRAWRRPGGMARPAGL